MHECGIRICGPYRGNHQAELRNGGIGQYFFEVVLTERGKCAYQSRCNSNDATTSRLVGVKKGKILTIR